MSFTHLHVHSQYSLLQAAIPTDKLIKRVQKLGMSSVALTDHMNLFGAVEFYEKGQAEGIQTILGCEVYYLPKGSAVEKNVKFKERDLAHLVLLVSNEEGYKNLCRLLSFGYNQGFYYKPRLDYEVLERYSEGLIALSGCSKGEVPRKIVEGAPEEAKNLAEKLSKVFPDRFYLEMADHGLPHERTINETMREISRKSGIPLVVTNNVHYLSQQDREAHEALLCIHSGHKLKEEDRPSYEGDEFYLKSPEEMQELFPDDPEALSNSVEIASKCRFDFNFKTYFFPKFYLEGIEPNLDPENEKKILEEKFVELTKEGFEERWPFISIRLGAESDSIKNDYLVRLEREIETIRSMGFASYFLIVADFINYAKSCEIPVGPGRGSAAGSLVAYCLKITDLDPIPYHLLFERFLNPERISMPDMDIDFCMNRRDEVIAYVNKKYGNVSQIITFGKMKAKAVLRDVGRVLDIPYTDVDKIAKMVPNTPGITLEEALKVEPRFEEMARSHPIIRKLLQIAQSLEGLTRHASTHAAGVVIADRPLTEFMPLYRGSHDEVVSQFDMKAVEKIGLVKFDFLGLKTLTLIDDAVQVIHQTRKIKLEIDKIPLDDAKVYETLCSGDGLGIFQLESSGMRDLLVKLKPNCFEDIIALVALYRPGPLGSGMVDDFINRKHGRTEIEYELPELEPILKDTYGVIVYQEQVMQIASVLAGFSLGDADLLRRAMGKKKPEEMAKQKERFIKGALEKKIPQKIADKIFDLMAKFAEYGFNKSHSAAYALVSYQTAYLKAHFTAEYLASLMTHEMGDTDKILIYIQDAQEHGISVLPPDINESKQYFSVLSDKQIRFGLSAVKNIGTAAIESILESRNKLHKFQSLVHFCENIDLRKVNKKVVESLIKSGAFDQSGISRAEGIQLLDRIIDYASANQKEKEIGQSSLFGLANDSLCIKWGEIPEWPQSEKLKNEKEVVGFYLTGHPLQEYQSLLNEEGISSTLSLKELPDKSEIKIIGIALSCKEILTKRGNRMGFLTLEDLKGQVEIVIFADLYATCSPYLTGDTPICITGVLDSKEEGIKVLANRITPLQTSKQSSVHLFIHTEGLDPKTIHSLKNLLNRYPGSTTVYLVFIENREKKKKIRLPRELEVEWSEQLSFQIQQLFQGKVEFKLSNPV